MNAPTFVSSFCPAVKQSASLSSFAPNNKNVNSRPIHVAPATQRVHASPRMLFGLFNIPQTTDKKLVDIPQKAADLPARKAKLDAARQKYQWTYEGIADAAMIKGLPLPDELPAGGWLVQLFDIVARVALNIVSNVTDVALKNSIIARVAKVSTGLSVKILTGQISLLDFPKILEELGSILAPTAKGPGEAIDEYKDLFDTLKLPRVAKNDQFLQDDIFGFYRIAGTNPMKLTKLTGKVTDMFPGITDALLQGISGFAGDTLAAAAKENRLYYVDYKEFDGLSPGSLNGVQKKSFVYAPKALLAVPRVKTDRATLLPIAIYCGQDSTFPMYTANRTHTDEATWIAAKCTVQSADAVSHEMVYHLGRCHLLEESVTCALHRTLPDVHPLFRLIKPHVYGTSLINSAAVLALVNPGGIVDQLVAPDIDKAKQFAASSIGDATTFDFNGWMPDVEMKTRGVMDDVLYYPYREYALEHWEAMNKFVKVFVYEYYKSDAEVQADYELQNFGKELAIDGKLRGFGEDANGALRTRDYLVRALSMIMFTASVQHSAVNFTQSPFMSFTPSMPLAGYAPPPKTDKPFGSVNEWVKEMLPNLTMAQLQLMTGELLSGVRYSMLGEYGSSIDFAGETVGEALEDYQEALSALGAKIQARNGVERTAGLPVYNQLVPKNVPLSINI